MLKGSGRTAVKDECNSRSLPFMHYKYESLPTFRGLMTRVLSHMHIGGPGKHTNIIVSHNHPSQRWDLECRDKGSSSKAIDLSNRTLLIPNSKAG